MTPQSAPPPAHSWVLEAQKRALAPEIQALVQNAIIAYGEAYSRILVWTDSRFVGFAATWNYAEGLARAEPAGTSVYLWDTRGSPNDHRSAFAVVVGMEGRAGPLPFTIRQTGVWLAQDVLAKNITAKRDIMLRTQAELRQKHGGNLPPLDSPPHPDRELWERVRRDFENAKIWSRRFSERHL